MTTGKGSEKDARMEAAGRRIVEGQRTLANVDIICRWKSARSAHHLSKNKEVDIDICLEKALKALQADDELSAMIALIRIPAAQIGLHGVQIAVASAIITALDLTRFTIIDYKALGSLGCPQDHLNVDFYIEYLQACRCISTSHGTSLRTLDRALWQWWKNKETTEKTPTNKCE
jgi:hypothetical protein